MRTESVSAAKNSLSALIDEVRGGAEVVITDRGVPVARLAPLPSSAAIPAALTELARRGLVTLPRRAPAADWATAMPWPLVRPGGGPAEALLAEREGAR